MKFEEFIHVAQKDIQVFKEWYASQQGGEDGEYFPFEMNEGDWWDQFLLWNQNR